jgi:hypothetical protein
MGAAQTPWTSDIDAAGFKLNNCPQIGGQNSAYLSMSGGQFYVFATSQCILQQAAPSQPIQLVNTNGGSVSVVVNSSGPAALCVMRDPNDNTKAVTGVMNDSPAHALDVTGDVNVTGAFLVNGAPMSGGSQTPWASDIDGGGHNLTNAASITVSNGVSLGNLDMPTNGGFLWRISPYGADWLLSPSDGWDNAIWIVKATRSIGLLYNTGIGTNDPHSPLAVVGLPTYANNAAALSGGLAAGDFYTDGAGAVKVVF